MSKDQLLRAFYKRHKFENWSYFNREINVRLDERFWNALDMEVYLPSIGRNLQRGLVWSLEQKQLFILSKIIGNYIPPITLVQVHAQNGLDYTLEVIDGKQRLSTIKSFINNEFPVVIDGEQLFYSDCEDGFIVDGRIRWLLANTFYSYPDAPITDQKKIEIFETCSFLGTPQDIHHLQTLKKCQL